MKNKKVSDQINHLTRLAHSENIDEVFVWDHSFYPLSYYPDRFKTGSDGTLDLDNADFWQWYKEDYRRMLDLVPDIDGLILTFIETAAYAEKQHSERMTTPEEKLAAVVNAVADVVIGEREKKLYIRTFAYSEEEYAGIVGCIKYIRNDKVALKGRTNFGRRVFFQKERLSDTCDEIYLLKGGKVIKRVFLW